MSTQVIGRTLDEIPLYREGVSDDESVLRFSGGSYRFSSPCFSTARADLRHLFSQTNMGRASRSGSQRLCLAVTGRFGTIQKRMLRSWTRWEPTTLLRWTVNIIETSVRFLSQLLIKHPQRVSCRSFIVYWKTSCVKQAKYESN